MNSPPSLQAAVGFEIQVTARAWRRRIDAALADLGLSDAAAWTLVNLMRAGDGVRLVTLSTNMGMEGPSIGRLLDHLSDLGLVDRREDTADRRAKTLHLTEAGVAVCARMETILQQVRAQLLDGVSPQDLEAFLRVLRVIQARADRTTERDR